MSDKIMIIDGNSIINRAFYGIPLLTNSDNECTNAVYGFLAILFKLLDEERPRYLAVAFDLPKPTFRHLRYAEYKGTRKGMPEELRPQLPLLKNLLLKMNIKIFEAEGFEADDILGTLAEKSNGFGLETVLVSGDRDMLQLASSNVKIRIPKTKAGKTEIEDYYEQDIIERMGVTASELIDVKALMGDTSDNIPGVPGIGEKTALKIIQDYKSLEEAIKNAEFIKPKKAAENLAANAELARLSKELATIVKDAPIELSLQEVETGDMFNTLAFEEIKRLEFKSFFGRFSESSQNLSADEDIYRVIRGEEEAVHFWAELKKEKLIAYEMIYELGELLGISFSFSEKSAFFIKKEALSEIMLKDFFESDTAKVTLDAKTDIVYLKKLGVKLNSMIFDCMIAGYLINASKSSYEFNDIAYDFLSENHQSEEELLGKGKSKKLTAELNEQQYKKFLCSQANILFRAYPVMKRKLLKDGQEDLYNTIEHPLIQVLADMEFYGIRVDKDALKTYGEALQKMIDILTAEIYNLAGEEFNINSPKQLGVILFEKLGLKGSKKTKTGWSTSADVLENLRDKHELVARILEYRSYTKLKSTYADGLIAVTDEKTGKIHSTFNQTITTTGRISSTEPNLQNIPIKLELGREIRKLFIPENEDFVFLDGDYSQIELRVLAHLADDETLINAFKEGQDIHRLTASQVFHIPFDEVTASQRSNAKAVNFGIVYGISAFSLSQDLGITVKEAERYIQGYFEKYPSVKTYLNETVAEAKKRGYAQTLFNRRRLIPELQSSNYVSRSFGERVAMNMPVQGTAADIIKIAMVRVHKRFLEEKLLSRLILQVHDELLVEAHKEEIENVKTILRDEMEQAVTLKVPLTTDFHVGATWYDAK